MTPEQKKWADAAKKKSKGAWKKSRTKEPVVGGILPGGLVGVVLRFIDYKLGEKDGKQSVSLTGIVMRPEDHAGARATKMHFLSESDFNTIEEAWDGLYSDLQLMGIDTTDDAHEDLEQLIKDLEEMKKTKPYYKINTWQKNKDSRVKLFFQGVPDTDEIAEIEAAIGDGGTPAADDTDGDDAGNDGDEPEADGDDSDGGDDEGDEVDASDDWEPAEEEEYGWQANSRAKIQSVIIKTVNRSKKTVSITLADGKTIKKDIKWDALQDAP